MFALEVASRGGGGIGGGGGVGGGEEAKLFDAV